ncbi:UNVERIFIED_CONTAM: hypothetical protein FKN15_061557 [Acipenser sinensis]
MESKKQYGLGIQCGDASGWNQRSSTVWAFSVEMLQDGIKEAVRFGHSVWRCFRMESKKQYGLGIQCGDASGWNQRSSTVWAFSVEMLQDGIKEAVRFGHSVWRCFRMESKKQYGLGIQCGDASGWNQRSSTVWAFSVEMLQDGIKEAVRFGHSVWRCFRMESKKQYGLGIQCGDASGWNQRSSTVWAFSVEMLQDGIKEAVRFGHSVWRCFRMESKKQYGLGIQCGDASGWNQRSSTVWAFSVEMLQDGIKEAVRFGHSVWRCFRMESKKQYGLGIQCGDASGWNQRSSTVWAFSVEMLQDGIKEAVRFGHSVWRCFRMESKKQYGLGIQCGDASGWNQRSSTVWAFSVEMLQDGIKEAVRFGHSVWRCFRMESKKQYGLGIQCGDASGWNQRSSTVWAFSVEMLQDGIKEAVRFGHSVWRCFRMESKKQYGLGIQCGDASGWNQRSSTVWAFSVEMLQDGIKEAVRFGHSVWRCFRMESKKQYGLGIQCGDASGWNQRSSTVWAFSVEMLQDGIKEAVRFGHSVWRCFRMESKKQYGLGIQCGDASGWNQRSSTVWAFSVEMLQDGIKEAVRFGHSVWRCFRMESKKQYGLGIQCGDASGWNQRSSTVWAFSVEMLQDGIKEAVRFGHSVWRCFRMESKKQYGLGIQCGDASGWNQRSSTVWAFSVEMLQDGIKEAVRFGHSVWRCFRMESKKQYGLGFTSSHGSLDFSSTDRYPRL